MQRRARAVSSLAARGVPGSERDRLVLGLHDVVGKPAQTGPVERARISVEKTAIHGKKDERWRAERAQALRQISGGRGPPLDIDDRLGTGEIQMNGSEAALDRPLRVRVAIDGFLHFQATRAIREGQHDRQLLAFRAGRPYLALQVVDAALEQHRMRHADHQAERQAAAESQPGRDR
jgi:hypothetical protein